LKISIGFKIVDGPWGGGNSFVSGLSKALVARGHEVVFDLKTNDIDIIMIIDPRSRVANIPYSIGQLLRYILYKNPRAIVLHRINECDERKNTRTMNFRLRIANYVADHTIFVGSWLRDLKVWCPSDKHENSVILNGADPTIFNNPNRRLWSGDGPLKLVTHHWGGNWMKGFDIYTHLDELLCTPEWRNRIKFTYIGNLPKGFAFKKAKHLQPLNNFELAAELSKYDAYVTGSMNEPGSNHQNEGALCLLPLLYRNSGCLPEYCDGFGISFDGVSDFETALQQMIDEYPRWFDRMPEYPHKIGATVNNYIDLIEDVYKRRDIISTMRKPMRNPLFALLTQVLP